MSNANKFLKKTLGDDFLKSLSKSELWKPGTKTVVDSEEIAIALKIVPRTIMSILVRDLGSMEIGDTKDIVLPVPGPEASINVTKHERDVYSGDVKQSNKVLVDFKYRSLPGLGLVIMSAFELYDVDKLNSPVKTQVDSDIEEKIQRMIDERLQLHDLVNKVIDRKLMQKEAVQHIVMNKLTQSLHDPKNTDHKIAKKEIAVESKKKGSPLKSFLEHRKNKPNEFSVEMSKGEFVYCPDCKKNIFDGNSINTCICYGDAGKIYLKKTNNGIKVRFGKNWDIENIEMLLNVMRKKNE